MKLNKTINNSIIAFLLIIVPLFTAAQQYKALNIGDQVPSFSFTLINDVVKSANLRDYKGKMIMLDFWSMGCSNCIDAFPKMEALQKQFGDKVKVILINAFEGMEKLNQYAAKNKKFKQNVGFSSLPASNGDTNWRKIFPHFSVPLHVWIDTDGKVVAMVRTNNVNAVNIQKVLDRQPLDLLTVKYFGSFNKSMLNSGIVTPVDTARAPSRFIAFAPFNPSFGNGESHNLYEDRQSGVYLRFSNHSVDDLYAKAIWFARRINLPVLIETVNKDVSYRPENDDYLELWSRKNAYCLDLFDQKATNEEIGEWIFDELNVFFGKKLNIKAVVENRKVLHYNLISDYTKDPEGDLPAISEITDSTIRFENVVLKDAIPLLIDRYEDLRIPRIFTSEGITNKKVNLLLTGDLNNLANLNRQLKPHGIRIVETMREIEVIVIKDK